MWSLLIYLLNIQVKLTDCKTVETENIDLGNGKHRKRTVIEGFWDIKYMSWAIYYIGNMRGFNMNWKEQLKSVGPWNFRPLEYIMYRIQFELNNWSCSEAYVVGIFHPRKGVNLSVVYPRSFRLPSLMHFRSSLIIDTMSFTCNRCKFVQAQTTNYFSAVRSVCGPWLNSMKTLTDTV